MKHIFSPVLLMLLVFNMSCNRQKNSEFVISAPAGKQITRIDRTGTTVLPNGRIITPSGKSYPVAPHPYGLALSNDGNIAVTANSGIAPLAITILKNIQTDDPVITQIPPGAQTDRGVLASVFMGLAISPDNKVVYVAGGQENKVFIFNLVSGEKEGVIDCSWSNDSIDYTHGYIGDMTLSHDGKWLYAVDQINFRMVILDTQNRVLKQNVPVGRYPFGIALTPDGKDAYVANVGMYAYTKVKQKVNGKWVDGLLDFPAGSYLSAKSEEGFENDSLKVAGLGKPNVPESFSVWDVDVTKPGQAEVTGKMKTGTLVGEQIEGFPAVGGSSPNSLVTTDNYVFVSNGTNDNISVIDSRKNRMVTQIALSPDNRIKHLRGIIPFGLAISPDQKRLYVAESGLNAVGIIDIPTLKLIGHLPVGWFPAKLKVTPDGKKLVVANAKGYGSGPNGGKNFEMGPEGSYIGNLMKGTVTVLNIPADDQLKEMTEKVVANNFTFDRPDSKKFAWRKNNPIPLYPKEKESPIKYIVFISKENRTFDEIFGQVKKANGDSTLARYGLEQSFSNRAKTATVEKADVMPNHLKLAKEFAIGDNFYVDADVSADGHRWLTNTYPNEWVESTTPANYGGNRDYREVSKAPGSLAMNGAAGAIYPEDYNEAGSMWDHFSRYKIPYFNFGFSVMFDPGDYRKEYKKMGIKQVANFPLPGNLYDNTSRIFPTFNMAIPDQFRVDMFIREFNMRWGTDASKLPSVLTVIIPNDHGAGETAENGYPFRESYMADNDLAIGRIVEFLSHTRFWKNMLIVVTEDDAQNGVDHVDAHRSALMVISPYVRRNYVSSVHYSFGSLFKTFWNVLGAPYLNQYDAGATDLADFFTGTPDFRPYSAVPSDLRVFDPQKAMDPLDEKFDWKRLKESPEIDNVDDMVRESKEQDNYRIEDLKRKK